MALGTALRHANATNNVRDRKRGQKRQEWLDRVDVVDFLEKLDVNNIQRATADEVKASCPFSGHTHGDTDPSLYMNTGEKDSRKTSVFKCHGCQRSGNAISFLAEHENISKQEAASHLRDEYAPDFRKPKGGIRQEFEKRYLDHLRERQRPSSQLATISWERYFDVFSVDWYDALTLYQEDEHCPPEVAYLFDRGFTAEALEQWGVGYDRRDERATIPVCDRAGNLVGVKARALDDERKPKYRNLGDKPGKRRRYGFEPYEKSHVVFGADRITSDWAVMCEGELDVIALSQINVPAVCMGSAALSNSQAQIIRSVCNEVVVFYDEDSAGKRAVEGYYTDAGEWKPGIVERLEPFIRVRIVGKHKRDPAKLIEDGDIDLLKQLIDTAELSFRLG